MAAHERRSESIHPRWVRRALFGAATFLLLIHVVLVFLRLSYGLPATWGPGQMFHFGGRALLEERANVPIWFSSVLMVLGAALLTLISAQARLSGSVSGVRWRLLCWFFIVLSFDSMTGTSMRVMDGLGIPTFIARWAPTMLALALMIVAVAFLSRLGAPHRARFQQSIGLYILAATGIGLARIGAPISESEQLAYEIMITVARLLEMSGVILLIYALLDYLGERERLTGSLISSNTSRSPNVVEISAVRVRRLLLGITVVLVLLHIAAILVNARQGLPWESSLALLVSLNSESNLPSWFSSVLFLSCAGVLAGIASNQGGRRARPWSGLAILFVGFSLDEAASLHERLIAPLRNLFDITEGVFFYAWVLAAIPAVVLLGLVYARFILGLRQPHRGRFLLAASLFLGGALGMELVGGVIDSAYDPGDQVLYQIVVVLEEWLEMLGLIVFLHALLSYAAELDLTACALSASA